MQRFAILCCCLLLVTAASRTRGHIKIAAYDLNPYVSQDRNEHGYLYEIITQAFTRAGYTFEIQFFPPARAKKQVESGAFDVLMPSYASPHDAANLVFSQPIHGSQVGYIHLLSEKTPPVRERREVRQAFEEAFSKDGNLAGKAVSSDGLFGEDEGVIKSSSDRIVRIIDMLASKRLKLAIADKFQLTDVLVNRRPNLIGKLKFVVPALATKDFHVAISRRHKDYRTVLDDFNRGLQSLQKSGEYERILLRYGSQIQESDATTLNIATISNADMEVMREMSQHFLAQHPGVRIRWHFLDENLLRRTILATLALNENVFDVITIGNYDTPIYAANSWIEPLTLPKAYNVDDILMPIRESLSYGGRIHALPFYGESSMTYYRRDLFDKAGLKMPEEPTFDQVRSFAEKLHNPDKGVYGICLRGKAGWGENVALLSTIASSFGGRWFDKAKEPSLQTPAWQSAVRYYTELLGRFGPPNAHVHGYKENLRLFAEGRCGMWIDATVAASYLMNPQMSRVAKTTAFAKMPSAQQAPSDRWLWTWALALPRSSGKKELAREFITWATSQEYIQLVAREKGWLAVPPGTRQSTYDAPAYKEKSPFGSFVKEQIDGTRFPATRDPWGHARVGQFVAIPEFTALGTSFGINISLVLQKRLSVEKALELSQAEAKRIMKHVDSEGAVSSR